MKQIATLLVTGGIILGVGASDASGHQPVDSPYFPLSGGSKWVYSVWSSITGSVIKHDTVRVIDVAKRRGRTFYHLSTPWIPLLTVWVCPDANGDLYWCESPGQPEYPLLLFSSEPESGWLLSGRHCMDSVVRSSCHTSPQSSVGSLEEVICFTGEWRPGDCQDAGWYGEFAEGVGPVVWQMIGVGGITLTWQLIDMLPEPRCNCKCHADPMCDGVLDILDVVTAVDVAFRGAMPLTDKGCWCYAQAVHGRTDVNGDGVTNILDVVWFVNQMGRAKL